MFLMEAFKEGGWGMYPILTLCIITVYITLERAMYLAKSKVNVEQLMSMVKSQIVSGNVRGAISSCDAQPTGLTKIIAAGLRKAEAGGAEHEIQQSMDEEALREATMLSKGISEAMNCTAFGLGTGILGLAAYAVLNGKTQAILDGVNQSSVETLNLVVMGRDGARH